MNKIKFGLKNVYYAPVTAEAAGVLTYGAPKPIPGAVNFNMEPQGEVTEFEADDITYWRGENNNGYSGTIEFALIPDDFRKDILGETEDKNDVVVEKAGVQSNEFALLFQFAGDDKATRHCFYRCTASRPSVASNTRGKNVEPVTETLNVAAIPRMADDIVKARCPEGNTKYAGWFSEVYEPDFTA